MKVLQENGLKAFMQSILNKFIKKEDTEQVTTVDVDTTPTNNSNHLITSGAVYTGLSGKVDAETGKGLFSGSYTDLTNKPTIPTVDQTYDETSANAQSGTAVAGAIADKLTEPSTNLAVGKYFRIASIDENGHAVLECVDPPTAPVQSISAVGTALVPDEKGNVNIPPTNYAYSNNPGLVYVTRRLGIESPNNSTGLIRLAPATITEIPTRSRASAPITLSCLDISVKAAMTDGRGAAWTDAERLAALLRMGCTVDENGFVKWTATPSEGE